MKKLLVLAALLGLVALLANCSQENPEMLTQVDVNPDKDARQNVDPKSFNPPPPYDIPEGTVDIAPSPAATEFSPPMDPATLTPASLTATLKPGESVSEHKVLFLPADVAPERGDVLFCMDLTGSMGGELNNAKTNSTNIMNTVRGLITDTNFGLVSHMDYPGSFTGCGYSSTYGEATAGDYAYNLDHTLSSDISLVSAALAGLSLGYGADGAESYTRPLYESYADPGIGWRAGAQKIIVAWMDNIPHDCNVDACLGGINTTGPDPGRDAIAGTADDLAIMDVLAGMAADNITLLALYSGYYDLALWDCYAGNAGPGGAAFQINSDGTIPGGVDIGEYIAGLIEEVISTIDELTLEVCDPAYSDWLLPVSPSAYIDIMLDVDQEFEFDIVIQVPEGTPDGVYCFDVCALGDGVEFARQNVCITVTSEIEVSLDIKPTSCPNPLQWNSNGVLPAAILGTMDFDIADIDPSTILLEGVAPIRWNTEDVATPFEPYIGKSDCEDCTTEGPDGYADLTLKFDRQSIIAALGEREDRECVLMTITGQLYDGTDIVGEDVIRYQLKKIKEK